MKKWICFLLSLVITLTLLTACDGKPSASGPQEIPGPTTPDGRPILKVGVSAGELSEEEYQFFEGLGEQLGYEIEIICRPQGVLAADDYLYNKAVREGEPLPDIILNLKTNFATNKALAERIRKMTTLYGRLKK